MISRTASIAPTPRLRVSSSLWLALVLAVALRAGSQQNTQNKVSVFSGQGSVAAQQQTLSYNADAATGGFDAAMTERRVKLLNNERHKAIITDSDKLFKLATELNNEIAHSNSGSLTPDELRKVAEIEKLAHNIRDKMTMTVITPSPPQNFLPIYGPPYN